MTARKIQIVCLVSFFAFLFLSCSALDSTNDSGDAGDDGGDSSSVDRQTAAILYTATLSDISDMLNTEFAALIQTHELDDGSVDGVISFGDTSLIDCENDAGVFQLEGDLDLDYTEGVGPFVGVFSSATGDINLIFDNCEWSIQLHDESYNLCTVVITLDGTIAYSYEQVGEEDAIEWMTNNAAVTMAYSSLSASVLSSLNLSGTEMASGSITVEGAEYNMDELGTDDLSMDDVDCE